MSKKRPSPIITQELIQNCQVLIGNKADKSQFEIIAKSVVLQMAESQVAPSSLKDKLVKLRTELTNEFSTAPSEYIITENKRIYFILSYLIYKIEKSTGIQDGKATNKNNDYPRILENVRVYCGQKQGEIILRKSIITEVKPDNSTQIESENEVVAIDVTEYLELAAKQLKSDDWTDIAIGVAMATLRREVEVCTAMSFQAKDEYTLVISTPVKKRSSGDYYEIPCLLPADDIEEAVERMRSMVEFERCDIEICLGNKEKANKEFNNSYKQPLLDRYNAFIREKLDVRASVDKENYFHQLRSVGTAILKDAKRKSYKKFSNKYESECLEFVKGCLVHENISATAEYGGWDVSNIPQYVIDLCNRSYGNVIKKEDKEVTLINFDIATLQRGLNGNDKAMMLFSEIFNRERLNDPKALGNALIAVFTQAVKEPEKKNTLLNAITPKSARGYIGSERVEMIVQAMMKHNETAENKIFICESQVRSAYSHIFDEQVGFNLVRKIFEGMGNTIDDHNKYKNLSTTDNLKLRGDKIKSVYESLKEVINNGL
jgi:hypothetical protein